MTAPHMVLIPGDLVDDVHAERPSVHIGMRVYHCVRAQLTRPLEVGDRVKSAPHGTWPEIREGEPWEIIAIADGHALLRARIDSSRRHGTLAQHTETVYQHAALCVLERVDA